MKKTRTRHSAEFKAKIALAAIREHETVAEICRQHKLHANIVYKWKRQLLDNLHRVFEAEHGPSTDSSAKEAELLQKIGELTVDRDFLSKGLARFR
jgi:transposase-like protein